jgi:hypothetical protein
MTIILSLFVKPRDPYAILTLENPTSSDDARSCLYTDPESDSNVLFSTSPCLTSSDADNLPLDGVEDNISSSRFSTPSPDAPPPTSASAAMRPVKFNGRGVVPDTPDRIRCKIRVLRSMYRKTAEAVRMNSATVWRICEVETTPKKPRADQPVLIGTPNRRKLVELATQDAEHRRKAWPEIALEAGTKEVVSVQKLSAVSTVVASAPASKKEYDSFGESGSGSNRGSYLPAVLSDEFANLVISPATTFPSPDLYSAAPELGRAISVGDLMSSASTSPAPHSTISAFFKRVKTAVAKWPSWTDSSLVLDSCADRTRLWEFGGW